MAEDMKPRLARLIRTGEIHRHLDLWRSPYALLQLMYQDCGEELVAYFMEQSGPRTKEELVDDFEGTCMDEDLIELLLTGEAGKLVFEQGPEGYSMRKSQIFLLADMIEQTRKIKSYMRVDGD